eukprot:25210_1
MAHLLAKIKLSDDSIGIVKFIGELPGKIGVFYGLDISKGKSFNDGTFEKQQFFKTKNGKSGRFVKSVKMKKIAATEKSKKYQQYTINKLVYFSKTKSMAKIRSIGYAPWMKKHIVVFGIELIEKCKDEYLNGRNGQYIYRTADSKPKKYQAFSCKKGLGFYVKMSQIQFEKPDPVGNLVNGFCRKEMKQIISSVNQIISDYFGLTIKLKPVFPNNGTRTLGAIDINTSENELKKQYRCIDCLDEMITTIDDFDFDISGANKKTIQCYCIHCQLLYDYEKWGS